MTNTEYVDILWALHGHAHDKNVDYYWIIDHLPNNKIIDFNEYLFKTKKILGKKYLSIVGINSQYKITKSLTSKQKQHAVQCQIEFLDDICIHNNF